MRKVVLLVGLIAAVAIISGWFSQNTASDILQKSPQGLIRFHVLANSDSKADQALKLKVRDAILRKFDPVFGQADSITEARSLIKENIPKMQAEAARVIKANGKNFPVKVVYGNFDFPVKSYGDLTLPAGRYEAVRVLIGKAEGANWWCVLFPPLCFVDVTSSLAENPALPVTTKSNPQAVTPVIKFKTVEVIKSLFK